MVVVRVVGELPHLHNCFEVGCCHAGGGVFLIADKVRSLRPGDCVVINDREPHCAFNHPSTPSEWSWLYIDPAGMLAGIVSAMPHTLPLTDTSPFCGPRFENVLTPERNPQECALIHGMVDELGTTPRHYRDTVRHALFLLLARLHRDRPAAGRSAAAARQETGSASYRGTLERLKPALEYVSSHYHERIEVSLLADLCSMGAEHFRRTFHRTLGTTPKRYVINMRIARACLQLKNSRQSIGMIALRNGFPDVSCFNREFRRQLGKSPREWRKGSETGQVPG